MKIAIFFVIFFILYFFVPGKIQNLVLFAGNMAFCYIMGGLRMCLFLLIASMCAYVGALAKGRGKTGNILYVMVFMAILGLLFVFKYANFFIQIGNDIQRLFTGIGSIELLHILAPIGISFYTLTILSYMLDVHYGTIAAEKNLLKFLCFCTYFPQLLSGPFNRFSELGKKFEHVRTLDEQSVYDGFKRILWGYFKKRVISDRLSIVVAEIFGNYQNYQGLYLLYGIVLFTIQLYADFSGYTDMVLGASQALGITLPENFNVPFYSRSIAEFWRRWHITLGAWCKDYVYYPALRSKIISKTGKWTKKKFGKKASKNITLIMGMFVIWFTVGFWHGGAWKYIIGTGLLHGFYICVSELFGNQLKKINRLLRINEESRPFVFFQRLRTVALVCVGFTFFRSADIPSSIEYIKRLFTVSDISMITDGSLFLIGTNWFGVVITVVALIILAVGDRLKYQYGDIRVWINQKSVVTRYAIYWGLIAMIVLSLNLSTAEFLYAQF